MAVKLSALVALAPTYPEVGATRAALLPRHPLGGGTRDTEPAPTLPTGSTGSTGGSGGSGSSGGSTGSTGSSGGSGGIGSSGGSGGSGGSPRSPISAGSAGAPDGTGGAAGGAGMAQRGARGVAPEGGRDVGRNGVALPAGYHHLRYRRRVGRGAADFHVAAGLLHSWRMHRAVGARVAATGPAVEGETVVVRLAGLRAPCRVVWSVPVVESDAAGVAGFGYGTLPGHPERGEEGFLVTLTADGDVWFDLAAFSVAATWLAKLTGPVGRLSQRLVAHRYAKALVNAVKRSH